jgi:hypothetical protein
VCIVVFDKLLQGVLSPHACRHKQSNQNMCRGLLYSAAAAAMQKPDSQPSCGDVLCMQCKAAAAAEQFLQLVAIVR